MVIVFTSLLGFPGGSVVKNSPANAGEARDLSLTPVSGRSPEVENSNHSSIIAWKIPWTEEPDGLWSMGIANSQTRL